MSYGINILFKQVQNKEEGYEQARLFAEHFCQNIIDVFQSIGDENFPSELYTHTDETTRRRLNKYWLETICNIHFVYFNTQNLLGIIGDYPESISSFADAEIYFQNTTDQNYDYEVWNKISEFKFYADYIKNMSEDKFLNTFYNENEQKKLIADGYDLDYTKKTNIYEHISIKLGITAITPYRTKHHNVTYFTMNAIQGIYQLYNLEEKLNKWLIPKRAQRLGIRYLRKIAKEKLGDKFDPFNALWKITIQDETDDKPSTMIKLEIFDNADHECASVTETLTIDAANLIEQNGVITLKQNN